MAFWEFGIQGLCFVALKASEHNQSKSKLVLDKGDCHTWWLVRTENQPTEVFSAFYFNQRITLQYCDGFLPYINVNWSQCVCWSFCRARAHCEGQPLSLGEPH